MTCIAERDPLHASAGRSIESGGCERLGWLFICVVGAHFCQAFRSRKIYPAARMSSSGVCRAPQAFRSFMARSFRSPVWSFLDQPQPSTDGKSETICKLCKKTFAYHGGTSNLQAYLECKHPHSFKVKSELQGSVEKSATRQKAQPLITQHAIAKPSATACSEPRKNAINDLITDWLVADLRPLSIVTGECFLRLFSFLEPGYTGVNPEYFVCMLFSYISYEAASIRK